RSSIPSPTSSSTSPITGSTHGSNVADRAIAAARGGALAAVRVPALREPLTILALAIIALFALGAVLATLIAPYDPLAQVLAFRRREFVEAAHAIGARRARILLRHLLPNAVAPLLVQASFDMGSAIVSAAGLSFIGFGAQPPTPEWGVMISEGRNFISTQLWLSLFPGLAILLTVGAFNLLGDALRDTLDPRLRRNQ